MGVLPFRPTQVWRRETMKTLMTSSHRCRIGWSLWNKVNRNYSMTLRHSHKLSLLWQTPLWLHCLALMLSVTCLGSPCNCFWVFFLLGVCCFDFCIFSYQYSFLLFALIVSSFPVWASALSQEGMAGYEIARNFQIRFVFLIFDSTLVVALFFAFVARSLFQVPNHDFAQVLDSFIRCSPCYLSVFTRCRIRSLFVVSHILRILWRNCSSIFVIYFVQLLFSSYLELSDIVLVFLSICFLVSLSLPLFSSPRTFLARFLLCCFLFPCSWLARIYKS